MRLARSLVVLVSCLVLLLAAPLALAQPDFWQEMNGWGSNPRLYGSTTVPSRRLPPFPVVGHLRDASIRVLAITPDGHVLAGTVSRGLFRSSDNGESWDRLTSRLPTGAVDALAASAGGELFAGAPDRGIFHSNDAGQSWELVGSALAPLLPHGLAVSETGTVFAGSRGGLLRSDGIYRITDEANSWVQVHSAPSASHSPFRMLSTNARGPVLATTQRPLGQASLFSGSPTGDRALEPVEVPRKVGCRRRGATCVALSTKGKGSRSYTG